MKHMFRLSIVGGTVLAALLSSAAQAQTARAVRKEASPAASDATSVRGCPRPAEAKDAQVIAFDRGGLETKLAVSLGKGEFKVVTIRLWDRPDDPRPVIPVVEAARIMQGKLQFYTPDLNAEPESVSNKFVLITEMGGPQICWATPGTLLGEGGYPVMSEASTDIAPAAANGLQGSKGVPRVR